MAEASEETLLTLTADIVAAYFANNRLDAKDVAPVIQEIHSTLTGLGKPAEAPAEPPKPAVPVRSSIKPDHLVSLESGKKMKMLKRYLMTNYQMTPDEYRKKWGLPSDYPMVAPNYSDSRKELAKRIGLGRKARDGGDEVASPSTASGPEQLDTTAAAPKRRGRPAKAGTDESAAPKRGRKKAESPVAS